MTARFPETRTRRAAAALTGAAVVVALALAALALMAGGEPAAVEAATDCESGTAVPEPAKNPGLVADCKALLAAKDTLRGTGALNWSAEVPIKQWKGVTFAYRPQRVYTLSLSRAGLNGSIPAGLGKLAKVRYIHLGQNALTGAIPAELGNLGELATLNLRQNKLRGALPAELTKPPLVILYVAGNNLSGCVPPELRKVRYNDLAAYPRLQDCATATATATPTATSTATSTPTATPTATATPKPTTTYTLTATWSQHGSLVIVPGTTSYAKGARVAVAARPAAGYQLTAWGGDCAATPATTTTCTLTMDANKTVSATFGKAAPSLAASPPPTLITVMTGKAGEILLEWTIHPVPAGVTGWQYRVRARRGGTTDGPWVWGAWTNVPGATAATRSYRLTGQPLRLFHFEVRAVAGSRTGRASASVQGRPPIIDGNGIPEMPQGQIVEGGRRWRVAAGSVVIHVPAGTRLILEGGGLSGGRVLASFRDAASGSWQIIDIGDGSNHGREIVSAAVQAAADGTQQTTPARDVGAIFDTIMASVRLVPLK